MEPRRFSAKTVDEAIDNALEALDVNREDVEIVVVNAGRSGILGFGGEPAEIDVTLLEFDGAGGTGTAGAGREIEAVEPGDPGQDEEDLDPDSDDEDEFDSDSDEDDEFESDPDDEDEFDDEPEPVASYATVTASEPEQGIDADEPESAGSDREGPEQSGREQRERPSEPDPEVIEFASEVIDYFLASMNVVADTYIREDTDDGVPIFDIEGEDSGLLIGRRGETLQSLQYLVNLIVTHQLGRSAYVQIDIEGYKERRRETLNSVALRTAERVADSGDAIELEPMPAYERRWVHMALANHAEVRTESSGEGQDRFVVVYPNSGGSDGSGGSGGQRSRRSRGPRRSPRSQATTEV